MNRAGVALLAGLTVTLAGCGSVLDQFGGGGQPTASCYVGATDYPGQPAPVNVTFTNPTSQPIQPEFVTVVTFDINGAQDWSDSAWAASGYLLGVVVAPGQTVTYRGNDAAYAPPAAVSCKVVSWQAN